MECVLVNIIWKILHSRWTVVLQLEWSVLQWTLFGRYFTARWTSVLQLEWIVVHWTLYGRYFTAGGQCYCSLNAVCNSEHYVEGTSMEVDSGNAAWMECVTVNIIWKILHSRWAVILQLEWNCVTVNIIWKILHSRWTVILQPEWSVLYWTLYGRYFRVGGQWYSGLNGVCYSEHYVEASAH